MSSDRLGVLDSPLLYAALPFPSLAFPVPSGPQQRGGAGGIHKERVSDVEEKRGKREEGRREERDHAEESGSKREGCRSAGRKEEEEAAGGTTSGRGDNGRAGSSRGGGEHRRRRKEEEAFRCFSERDVKTENKNCLVNGLPA